MLASIRFLFAASGTATFSLSGSRTFSFSSLSSGIFCSSGPRVFSSFFSSCGNSSLSSTRKFSFYILPPIFSSAMPYFAFFSLFFNALLNDTFHPLLGILALLFCRTPLARLSPCFRRTAVLHPRVKSKFLFPFLTHFPLKWLGEVILYQALYDHVLYSHNLRD